MYPLSNPVRDYAWGSRRRLAEFLGREPTGGPEAELWIGAHQGDPSLLPDGRGLDRGIAEDPLGMLGEQVHHDHGARLPFLMKVLAVGEPLSLQVHPDSERARIGFGRENQAGVALDAPERSYKDAWHKPELIYALSRFEGMAGFRDVRRTCAILAMLRRPWSEDVCARLGSGHPQQALRAVVGELLAMEPDDVRTLLADLVDAVRAAAAEGHRQERVSTARRSRALDEEALVRREAVRVFDQFPTLVEHYPADPGVLVTLLLNHVVLAPGEAMFVGAGVIHAYVSGFGVEIMAASDNVLRAGLTPKHRNVPELMAVTDFTPIPAPRWDPVRADGSVARFEPPVPDFDLTVGCAAEIRLPPTGPAIVLALGDGCTATSGADVVAVARGTTLFVPDPAVVRTTLAGPGQVAVGSVTA